MCCDEHRIVRGISLTWDYDIEIGAREQAEGVGIQFARTESLNTSPLFIKALAAVVQQTMG